MAFPTTSVLDNFNRADAGPPPSASWTTDYYAFGLPGLKVSSNTCVPDAAFAASWWSASSFSANQEGFVTVSTFVNEAEVAARIQVPGTAGIDCYSIYVNTTAWRLYRTDNQVSTIIANGSVTFANGERLGIECNGTTITGYRYTGGAWGSLGSTTDATYNTTGFIGIYFGSASSVADDFGGGAVVAAHLLMSMGIGT